MIRRPPRFTRTDTLFPYTTLFRSIDEFSKRYDAESNLSFSAIFLSPDDSKAFGRYGGRNGEKIQNWTMRKWPYCIPPRYTPRSEEHTSGLLLLMRTSYAALCLYKYNTHSHLLIHHHHTLDHYSLIPTHQPTSTFIAIVQPTIT